MRNKASDVAVVLFTLAFMGFAPDALPQVGRLPALKQAPGWERWSEAVPVSGGVRVGVMTSGRGTVDPDRMTVFLPRFDEPRLCVELSSQDGRYSAHLEYDLKGKAAGQFLLELPSAYKRQLTAYDRQKLAILASLSQDCSGAPAAYVLAGWRVEKPGDTLLVMINSRLPTMVRGGSDGGFEAACNSLDEAATAYNLRCEIPLSVVTPGAKFSVVTRRGSGITQLPLPLRLP